MTIGPRVRWAIVGAGQISAMMISDLRQISAFEVSAVFSRTQGRADRFAATWDIPFATDDFDALLDDPSIDAVYLATPFAVHHEMALRAVHAGKHVLIEKPMATSSRDAEEVFTAAAERGVFVMEAMWMKFAPALEGIKAEIEAGRIGRVASVRADFSVPAPDDGGGKWDPLRSGGALFDQGIYPVTLIHTLLGTPDSVAAVSGTVRADGLDLGEQFVLEYSDGRYGLGSAGMAAFGDCSAAVGGTLGWIAMRAPFWSTTEFTIHVGDYESMFVTPRTEGSPREGFGYVPMLRAVADDLRAGRIINDIHGPADTIEVLSLLETIASRVSRNASIRP